MIPVQEYFINFNKRTFTTELVAWFLREQRQLPWRETKNPYHIWISEIMLQQTRVDTVIPYYNRFTDRFPTPHDLAAAEQSEVLKYWEGLGYYSRVKNLQIAVQEVVEKYGGIVPDEKEIFESLRGVGPYTTGAVLSIAYGQAEPAVDGNVMRVLSRVLGIYEDIAAPKTRKLFEAAVHELIDPLDPSSFNQGLMELGAIVCTPKSPMCGLCPVNDVCFAYERNAQGELPVKTKKGKTQTIQYDALVYEEAGKVAIEQRPDTGLLGGMWQYPLVESTETVPGTYIGKIKHIFSHRIWEVSIYRVATQPEGTVLMDEATYVKRPISVAQMKIDRLLKEETT
ncbi:A/G-specific adenine glycosylase [Exiguobacterium sp. H66]|uniref:A/G-specific adenine glycosylase n=1 Tax=Exiguobacterium sp. H66 TaxID=2751208 RepID=UPI001BE87D0D|nr:A/G-specific adenine glycosylase [Exiguobacterium sp. H66]